MTRRRGSDPNAPNTEVLDCELVESQMPNPVLTEGRGACHRRLWFMCQASTIRPGSACRLPVASGDHPRRQIQYISEVPLVLSTLFSRVSICLFLLRLFAINISWRWTLYVIIGLTTAANIASATITLIQREPTAQLWNPMLPGTCWKPGVQVAIGQFQGGGSVELSVDSAATESVRYQSLN